MVVDVAASSMSLVEVGVDGEGVVLDTEAEAYVQRQLSFDPDIWVLEVEDPGLRYILDGPLIT